MAPDDGIELPHRDWDREQLKNVPPQPGLDEVLPQPEPEPQELLPVDDLPLENTDEPRIR